jgi:hypothetical protein
MGDWSDLVCEGEKIQIFIIHTHSFSEAKEAFVNKLGRKFTPPKQLAFNCSSAQGMKIQILGKL